MARMDGSWESVFGGVAHFRTYVTEFNYTCGEPIKRLLIDANKGSKRKCSLCQAIVTPAAVRTKRVAPAS